MSKTPSSSSEATNSPDPEHAKTTDLHVRVEEPSPDTSHAITSLFRRRAKPAPHEIATQPSVFDDPKRARFFVPHEEYENLHRFDPSESWTWAEEIPIIRKLDWKVTAWSCLALFALDLDRSNLSQANTDSFLTDLHLNTNDYNLGNTVFKVSFLLAELPSQLISKKLGPDRWIPAQMILWSIVAAAQFKLNGRKSFLACRALLGAFQGGFIPDVILYLTYFFKSSELPFRLSLFYTANHLTDIFGPLLAYGILHLRGYHGYEGWRWLFLLEGVLSLAIGIWSIFLMVPSATQTKTWFRPRGWFTEREEKIQVNRILRDDPSKGGMHNREAITLKSLWKSMCDYDIWPIYMIGLVFGIPATPPAEYLTLMLRGSGFDTFQTNLLTIPPNVVNTLITLVFTYMSEKVGQRAYFGLLVQFWYLPCVTALAVLPGDASKWSSYALLTVLLSHPEAHPMQVGWCSRNSNSVRTRTVSAALYNISVQIRGIASSNIYREDDKPLYRRGNRVLVGANCLSIALYVGTKVYYTWRNRQKEKKWKELSEDGKTEYLDTTTDEGSKRIDFRFVT